MKPKTEELLYFLLWSSEVLYRPTWRNLTDSFEGWAYRNGLHKQLFRLEKLKFVERHKNSCDDPAFRLSEAGRLHALGGRDPEVRWSRAWDGFWRMVIFDLPISKGSARDKLRRYLRSRGFGYLQNSVWITPDSFTEEREVLSGSAIDVETLILLEAKPCAGESDGEIVAGAWDFDSINDHYIQHQKVLAEYPQGPLKNEAAANAFRRWSKEERDTWQAAVSLDPLLPQRLLPPGYKGRAAWFARRETFARAAVQIRSFNCGTR